MLVVTIHSVSLLASIKNVEESATKFDKEVITMTKEDWLKFSKNLQETFKLVPNPSNTYLQSAGGQKLVSTQEIAIGPPDEDSAPLV